MFSPDLADLERDTFIQRADKKRLEDENERLRTQVKQLEQENHRLRQEFIELAKAEDKQRIQELNVTLGTSGRSSARRTDDGGPLQCQLDQLKEDYEQLQEDTMNLNRLAAILNEELRSKIDETAALKLELVDVRRGCAMLYEEISRLDKERCQQMEELQQLQEDEQLQNVKLRKKLVDCHKTLKNNQKASKSIFSTFFKRLTETRLNPCTVNDAYARFVPNQASTLRRGDLKSKV